MGKNRVKLEKFTKGFTRFILHFVHFVHSARFKYVVYKHLMVFIFDTTILHYPTFATLTMNNCINFVYL